MAPRLPLSGYILGLDVGDKRIGAALTSVIARLPQPIDPIAADSSPIEAIKAIIATESVQLVVIGLPRNSVGQETAQSAKVREFAHALKAEISVPVEFADESLSSVRADELLKQNTFKNTSQDSLAACFILEEYLDNVKNTEQK